MLTKRQLCTRVLREALPVADALSSPSAEDQALVEGIYDTKHKAWRDRGLVYWANTNATTEEIPEAVADALIALLGNACGGAFSDGLKPLERMAIEEQLLIPLRRHTAKPSAGESVDIEYF